MNAPLPDRRAARSRFARRLASHARRYRYRRDADDQRAEKPLSAGRRPRTLLLAGGIGVTPILAMAEPCPRKAPHSRCTTARARPNARLSASASRSPVCGQVHFHYDSGDREADLAALLAGLDRGTHVYVCGPQGFIDHVLAGRPPRWIGRRASCTSNTSARPRPDTGGDQPFDVKLASSGKVLHHPGRQHGDQGAGRAGVDIPYSCEEGVCGTCLTRVLDGVPDHRDLYLTEEEQAANDQFTPCCSRSRSAAGAGFIKTERRHHAAQYRKNMNQ
jgi:vanillate O-demethylase ferredoxin subunit